jgi:ATP adenylyltransferase
MHRLWAPWRIGYVEAKNKTQGCIFCKAAKSRRSRYVFIKNRYSFAILNIYPYNNGHSLIAPCRHIKQLDRLSDVEKLDLFSTLQETKSLLTAVLKPQGYNIGINTSPCAGAGIAGHLHIHIVPRWRGDTNFMPVIYETKIISQSLSQLYRRIKYAKSKADKRNRK